MGIIKEIKTIVNQVKALKELEKELDYDEKHRLENLEITHGIAIEALRNEIKELKKKIKEKEPEVEYKMTVKRGEIGYTGEKVCSFTGIEKDLVTEAKKLLKQIEDMESRGYCYVGSILTCSILTSTATSGQINYHFKKKEELRMLIGERI